MKFHDKITLGFSQSLMIGHRPENLTIAQVGDNKVSKDLEIEKFGLFEVATPNFHTYYPDVKAEDLVPKDSDFIKPLFRALSEVIVHKKHNPIDFSMNGVLKASINKLLGQTVYANHESSVGNEVGSVSAVSWQKSYTTDSGILIPAGINAEFKIDAKSHPNLARKILMDPPAIHSNSVTVQFAWETSHPSLDINEFWSKLGTYGADGNLIRRIVTDIPNYHETSLVAHGADPFAMKVGTNGEITNPEYAEGVYSLSQMGKEKPKHYFFSYKNPEDITSLSRSNDLDNINSENDMKELIQKLAIKLKKPESEITEDFILNTLGSADTTVAELTTTKTELVSAKTELETEKTKTTQLTTELVAEKAKVTEKEGKITELKPVVDDLVSNTRSEVKRLYGLIKGEKVDAAKLALIDKYTLSELQVSLREYNEELEKDFPASCKGCGGTEISRNTAKAAPENPTSKPVADVLDDIRNENKSGWIFDSKS
jgi:hypothetical protein